MFLMNTWYVACTSADRRIGSIPNFGILPPGGSLDKTLRGFY